MVNLQTLNMICMLVLEPHHTLLIGAAYPALGSISEAKQPAIEKLADVSETSIQQHALNFLRELVAGFSVHAVTHGCL